MTTTTLRTIRLTSLQAALLFKADKTIKAQLTVVAKAPAAAGEKPDWYKVQATPEVAQKLMDLFTAMSKAKTSPIKMKLHQHAVCGAAARYIGDLLAGSATVAVLASKQGTWAQKQVRLTKMVEELITELTGVTAGDLTPELMEGVRKLGALSFAAEIKAERKQNAKDASTEGPKVLQEIFKLGKGKKA